MTQSRFKSQRERAAYALGFADAQRRQEQGESKPLSRKAVAAMSPEQAAERLDEIAAWQMAGMPEPEDDDE